LKQVGISAFFDEDIKGGESWQSRLQGEINRCRVFALVATPESLTSHWVRQEMYAANSAEKKIFTILLQKTHLPVFLSNRNYHDLTEITPKQYQSLISDLASALGHETQKNLIDNIEAPPKVPELLSSPVLEALIKLIEPWCAPSFAREGLVQSTRGVTLKELGEEDYESDALYATALIIKACSQEPNALIAAQNLLANWSGRKGFFDSSLFAQAEQVISHELSQLDSVQTDHLVHTDQNEVLYYEWMGSKTTNLQLDALDLQLSNRIKLSDIYIRERGIISYVKQDDDESSERVLHRDEIPLINSVDAALRHDANALMLLGPAGSGKTTTLLYLANCIIRTDSRMSKLLLSYLPFFLPLKAIPAKKPNLAECLTEYCRREGLKQIPRNFFKARLEKGKCLVMLDGLDEIAERNSRQLITKWIQHACAQYPNNFYVVTCRDHVYRELHASFDKTFLRVDVQALSQSDIQRFLESWYDQIEALYAHDDIAPPFQNARTEASHLTNIILRRDQWVRMATNPLMLQIMALVNLHYATLPEHRADLYRQCIIVLSYGLDKTKRLSTVSGLDEENMLSVLERIAGWFHSEVGRTQAPIGEIQRCLSEHDSQTSGSSARPLEVFDRILERGALFYHNEGVVGFKHLAFQEFLTASSFVFEQDFSVLAEKLESPWWREVIMLLLGHRRPPTFTPFMKQLISNGTFEKERMLILECVRAAAGTNRSPDVFVDLLLDENSNFNSRYNALLALREIGLGVHRTRIANALVNDESRIEVAVRLLLEIETPRRFLDNKLPATWRNPKDGMQYVLVEKGSFKMGARDDEDKEMVIAQETPAQEVYLDSYYIAIHPVTNKQYRIFLEANRYQAPRGRDQWNTWIADRYPPGMDHHPVVFVTWSDAKAYCKWAGCALPTEAQWEKAARGPECRLFPWADSNHDFQNLMNFDSNVGRTTEVGFYPEGASPYGCLDMAGNVWEWCEDWFGSSEYWNRLPGAANPTGPRQGTRRVDRGGGWQMDARRCRTAYRGGWLPDNPDRDLGFRTVFSVKDVTALMAK
jgi:formylglycine-generating enzyme required for sulfatase activity/energy-coupling factor transporter ATP-binding protein EcfA2